MQKQFISLSEAETVVMKSRATLVRLCHKFERVGDSFKDDAGQWHISREALVNHYNVTQRKEDAKGTPQNDGMVQWLQSRVEELESRLKEMIYSNQSLIQENARLKQLEQPEKGRGVVYWFAVAVLGIIVLVLLFLLFP